MIDSKYAWQGQANGDKETIQVVADATGLPAELAALLVNQGIKSADAAQRWLNPQAEDLHTPDALHGVDRAVERIMAAVEAGEKITVYGDYDADGITATTLMYEALETLGAQVDYYVPDRFTDGYGPNQAVYQRLIEGGTQLIVTVDNGVAGLAAIEYAKEQGVDVVITDHHALPEQLPPAVAIVHPQYPGSEYPFADLSGVGVAFEVAWALLGEFPVEMLDLVAIGELADLVSLAGENHALVALGLQQLRQGSRPGLHALLKLAGVKEATLTGTDVGFQLAPRLNALGRIEQAGPGVVLLSTFDEEEAERLAKEVDQTNEERKQLVEQITKEALAMAANQQVPALVLVGHGWHQGVLGIVAAHVVQATGKPTIVASANEGETIAKGSGRSVEGLDLFAALDQHRDLMTAFGGHAMACGMSFELTAAAPLQAALNEEVTAQGFNQQQKPPLKITLTLAPDRLTQDLYTQIQRLAPFGPGNEEPQIELDVKGPVATQVMGKDKSHLKLRVGQPPLDVVAFGKASLAPALAEAEEVKLVGTLSLNEWRGKTSCQLMLTDVAATGVTVLDQRTARLLPPMFEPAAVYLAFDERLRNNINGHANGPVVGPKDLTADLVANQELVVVDCPPIISQLTTSLAKCAAASSIRLLCYFNQAPLTGIPAYQAFANLYRLLGQNPNININQQVNPISNYLRLPADQLIFMINVFFEAGFVTIKDGVLNLVPQAQRRDLKETTSYRRRQAQLEVERALVHSSHPDLVAWVKRLVGAR